MCRVVVAVVAILAAHDAVARLEAAVPALADDALPGQAMVEFALRTI
jgi:hypothetical protein